MRPVCAISPGATEVVLSRIREYLGLVGIASLVLALDQLSKYLVRTRLALGETWSPFPWLAGVARVVYWNNTGAAFGIFPSGGLLFTIIAVIVSVAILYYYPRLPRGYLPLRLALGLQLGGAVGNLIDRVLHGTVIDFISVGSFPVFNLADGSISLGVAILIVTMWIDERRNRGQQAEMTDAGAGPIPQSGASSTEHPLE
jgi:signal peptidase II